MSDIEKVKDNNSLVQGDIRSGINISDVLTDVIGLKEPLKKFIEVIEKGVGKIAEPYLTKRQAKAMAKKIETIADIIGEKRNLVDKIEYKDTNINILAETTLEERALTRIDFQQKKKQENIENITSVAFEQLINEESISNEPVDEEWIIRFFNMAEDVSNADMQLMWGKILAGEIKTPKSFSLRTLELLKNISYEEAKIFEKISRYSVYYVNNSSLIFTDYDYLESKNISFADLLLMKELGILHPTDVTLNEEINQWSFIYGDHIVFINNKEITNFRMSLDEIHVMTYTKIGEQLLKLVEPSIDELYLKRFVSFILADFNGGTLNHRSVQYSKIRIVKEGSEETIECGELIDMSVI